MTTSTFVIMTMIYKIAEMKNVMMNLLNFE